MNVDFETFDRHVTLNEVKGMKTVRLNVEPTFHNPASSAEDLNVRLDEDDYESRQRRGEMGSTRFCE
jgi:hypothetical protein